MSRVDRMSKALFLFAIAWGWLPSAASADLDAYFAKPEPGYRWEKKTEQTRDGCTIYDLHLVSQEWQGRLWEHRLVVFKPEKPEFPYFCTILNTGGNGGEREMLMGIRLAKATGAAYAILFNIPNQPLYDRNEDALVVYTWLKYMETRDESWPLHFPMAKAVLKAMDAIQALSRESGFGPLNEFLINGGSKRGWTTYLAAASRDPRVKAIVPMVIDVLNLPKQTEHMTVSYGKFSEQIDDYTSAGIQQLLTTQAGKRLVELEDPYSYRDRYTMPKLLILGTNDRYWTQDALNLYWDDLKGPKWVLYTPNSGHGLEDRDRVYATLAGFARMVAGKGRWPKLQWKYVDKDGGAELQLSGDLAPSEARLFYVTAPTKDFRDSRWNFMPMKKDNGRYVGHWKTPPEGYVAVFGEAVYTIDGKTFTLSTQIRILGTKPAATQKK